MKPVIIGDATLYLYDCIEMWNFLPVDGVLVTDPPYGLGKRLSGGSWGATADHKEVLEWDSMPPQSMIVHLRARYKDCIIWGGNYFELPASRGWLVWSKPNAVPTAADCELAWTSYDMNTKQFRAPVEKHTSGHPTEKPLSLMSWCLSFVDKEKTVIDPFMGSGTTGVAAIQMGRKFVGIESNERYFEMACERIEKAVAQGKLFLPEQISQVQDSLI